MIARVEQLPIAVRVHPADRVRAWEHVLVGIVAVHIGREAVVVLFAGT